MSKHPNTATLRRQRPGLFFSLPFGSTDVIGALGRLDVPEESGGVLVSFFGFFAILLLRCSPLAMGCSSVNSRMYLGGMLDQHARPIIFGSNV